VDGNSASDGDLLDRARRGDEAAFFELYERYRRCVFQFSWRLTGSEAAAEDVAQECFLALLDGADYDSRYGALRTYLLGIARHRAIRRMRVSERESAEADDQPGSVDTLGELLAAERAEMVARAVAALPLPQREAVILFEYEELSMEEIAAVTGVEVGAVKSRLFRARESLRRRLGPLLAAGAARSSR
jgi:RNA polymerase sigma-70 factor (ECF subfamily)